MKKIAIIAAIFAVSIFSANAQKVEVVSDAEFAALLSETKAADAKVRTTTPRTYESGKRAFHVTAGASYGKDMNGTLSLGYQVGKNGGFEFGGQAEGGSRFSVYAYAKQNLGRYHAESKLIPALKLGVGASEQDMWCGRSTDPDAPQGVRLAIAAPRMAFSAIAEFDLKWKPTKKEPRFYVEVYGGYRLTPNWGKEMPTGTFHSNGGKVYEIDSPLKKSVGHFYGGVRLGWAIYRLK